MTEIRLFQYADDSAEEITGSTVELERQIQQLIERHMESFFGVRFVASEHSTGPVHGGRIDSLGLAHDGSPVIFEYKRGTNENVVNQALYYRHWLLDHRGDFHLLVMQKLGAEAAAAINWSSPRLICIAADFTKYDEYAVQQHSQPIELVRYRLFGDELVMLDWLSGAPARRTGPVTSPPEQRSQDPPRPQRPTSNAALEVRKALITKFSTQLLEYSRRHTNSHVGTQPGHGQYFYGPSIAHRILFSYAVLATVTSVSLVIHRPDPDENVRIFETLREKSEDIERSFGEPLEWHLLSGYERCRVSYEVNVGGYQSAEEDWPAAIEETVAKMVKLQHAFRTYLEEVDS